MNNIKKQKSLQESGILEEVKLPNGKINSVTDIKDGHNNQIFKSFEDFVTKIKNNNVILRIDEIFTRIWGTSPSNKKMSRYFLTLLSVSLYLIILITLIVAFLSKKYFLLFFIIPIYLMKIRSMWLISILGLIIYYILYQQTPFIIIFLIWSKIVYFLIYNIPLRLLSNKIIGNEDLFCHYLNNGIIALSFPKEKKWLSIKNGVAEWWNQSFFDAAKKRNLTEAQKILSK